MKARVKETGEIIIVEEINSDGHRNLVYKDCSHEDGKEYYAYELEFINSDMPSEQRMKYELVKAAIQGILSNSKRTIDWDDLEENSCLAIRYAEEIINQFKEEEDNK